MPFRLGFARGVLQLAQRPLYNLFPTPNPRGISSQISATRRAPRHTPGRACEALSDLRGRASEQIMTSWPTSSSQGPQSEQDLTVHSLNIQGTFFERWCQHIVRT